MPQLNYRNGPATSLSAGVDAFSTTIEVDQASGFPTQRPYRIIVDKDTVLEEIMLVTNVVGTTLTVTRGDDNSTASAHAAGAVVVHGVTAGDHQEANDHVYATGNVHGANGTLVDTGSEQTITGRKVFQDLETSGGNVVDVGSEQAITGKKVFTDLETVAGGDVVAVGGSQTITGTKTHTAPTILSGASATVQSATNGADGQPRTKLTGDGLGRAQEVVVGHYARKTANEALVASTTAQPDEDLSFPVQANAKYQVRLCLFWQANNLNDAKVGWDLPSGSFNMVKSAPATNIASGTSGGNGDWGAARGAVGAMVNVGVTDGSIEIGVELTALLEIGATGGTATVQWAQVAAGSTLTLMAGSWLHAVRVA